MYKKVYAILEGIQHDDFVNQLHCHLQPIYSMNSNDISHAEILARWTANDLGVISPELFIPIAEQLGLLHLIGRRMLAIACNLIENERRVINSNIKFNVNLSPSEFTDENYEYWKKELLQIHFGQRINIELTEQTDLVNSSPSTIEVIKKFQNLGLSLYIDDFGSGYSGFHYLRLLDANYIKLDRGLIENITSVEKEEKLIKTIISLAHDLNLKVVAEGVENKSQYEKLRELECDFVQGYYLCRPLDISKFLDLL